MILGIDPGPELCAYAAVDLDYAILGSDKISTKALIELLEFSAPQHVALESIQSYGMMVGRSTFDTCYAIGRIMQACDQVCIPYTLYPRPEYSRRICGVGKVNDSVLRQALLLRFGGDKKGEPLNALKGCSDKRSAFAVACYHIDLMTHGRREHGPEVDRLQEMWDPG